MQLPEPMTTTAVRSFLPLLAWQHQRQQMLQTLTLCELSGGEGEYWAYVSCGDVGKIRGVTCAVTGGAVLLSRLYSTTCLHQHTSFSFSFPYPWVAWWHNASVIKRLWVWLVVRQWLRNNSGQVVHTLMPVTERYDFVWPTGGDTLWLGR